MSGTNPPNGIVCTADEYERSLTDKSIHCLNRTDGIGLSLISEAGFVSLVAVLYVFFVIWRNGRRRARLRRGVGLWISNVFQHPMDILMFSLFSADILQAIGAVMDIKWIHDGKVEVGSFCNAQGIVQNVGETAVAMSTLAIAVYTFLGCWAGRSMDNMLVACFVVGGIWLFIGVVVIVGNTIQRGPEKGHFQAPTPFWCWVSSGYMTWRILGEYMWFWLTLGFSLFVYIPLYFWLRGNIVFDKTSWWKLHFQHADRSDRNVRSRRRQAFIMAAYPVVYCFNILPLSVVRWIGFVQERNHGVNRIPPAATFAAATIYGLSGFCNVILFLTTRPDAGLLGGDDHYAAGRPPSIRDAGRAIQEVEGMPYRDNEDSRFHQEPQPIDDDCELGKLPSRNEGRA